MPRLWRAVRRRVLTPAATEALLERRGFFVKSPVSRELLETVGKTFVLGYGYAAEAKTTAAAERDLETVDREFRGFAYEGAAMCYAVRDALRIGGGSHVAKFLAGRGGEHAYMAHVGIGWALARLPRWRWRAISPTDRLHRWLALDGFGFHQAYFHTERYVRLQHRDATLPWPSASRGGDYTHRAIDQGIGRALWFVEGADPDRVATLIGTFAVSRQSDLWSGAGLAATYAGGAGADELRTFRERAGRHRPAVAQGSAFAAKARVRAGLVTAHTRMASEVFCGVSPEESAALTDKALIDLAVDRDVPSYEVWRRRVADEFVSLGRC